jgi:nitric oxide reductase NorD protein|tara:strand:+ start:9274 stop:11172 length:1899 start_codon:yes stop_codon:yes gene_type:complete
MPESKQMSEHKTKNVLDNILIKKSMCDNEVLNADYLKPAVQCEFSEASNFIRHFVRGLGGRELQIISDKQTFTDTESLYLPAVYAIFPFAKTNFTLYKLTAAHLWAQTWYGTWCYEIVEKLIRHCSTDDVMPVFNRLECIRLDACMARDFPGLAREFEIFGYTNDDAFAQWSQWREYGRTLIESGTTAEDSIRLIDQVKQLPLPPLKNYQGEMFVNQVHKVMIERIERDKSELTRMIQSIDVNEMKFKKSNFRDASLTRRLGLKNSDYDYENQKPEANIQLMMGAEMDTLSNFRPELISSILQDFDGIPEEYLQLMDLGNDNKDLSPTATTGNDRQQSEPKISGIFRYREWDYRVQQFHENFCSLRELPATLGDESFVDETLKKYLHLVNSLKRTFEGVLLESQLQRRQSDGDDLDLDAIIKAYAEVANGQEMSEYLYTRYRNQSRNIAVMFMVDMSGSTVGWVNKAEKESLVLLCEALEMLGDRYAIFGFSGRSNQGCEVYRIKTFDQPYDLCVRQRISGIKPKSFTRMGAAIRHLGSQLQLTLAHTKLLITLSDGRPEDCDGYKGQYGIEDTRHALREIQKTDIQAFCITIDKEAQEYLPYMYGAANYTVIDEVDKLPQKVTEIYRRLTT